MHDAKRGRGGPGRGQGRKWLGEPLQTTGYTIRLTPEQREKLEKLGGARWLRDRIDLARE